MQPDWEREYVEFVTTAMPRMRRLAYLLCGDAHRGDDLVQQTFTTLYVHWPRVRTVNHLDGYVRTILVRFFQGEKRRPWSKRVRLTDSPPEPLPEYGPDVEERTVLRAALDRVPRKQRAVLVLRFLCDMSVTEVAETLGCSPGTVKSQSFHGLATLRRLLDERSSFGDSPEPSVRAGPPGLAVPNPVPPRRWSRSATSTGAVPGTTDSFTCSTEGS